MALWYDEVHQDSIRFGLRIERSLFIGQSEFQKVSVVETSALGRALLIDDLWMTAERDEKPYHEMIVHPALLTAPRAARVLIIGGGDGGTAREVLRHPSVRHVDLVEVDALVVEACREHLPSIGGGAWADPRLRVTIGDGIDYVKNADVDKYDVVIVDGSDPVGPAVGLFDEAFYVGCKRVLATDGVFVTQSESPRLFTDVHVEMVQTLRRVFKRADPYYGTVSIYPGGAWSWTFASDSIDPLHIDTDRALQIEAVTEIYTRDVHRGAFAIPNHIRRRLTP